MAGRQPARYRTRPGRSRQDRGAAGRGGGRDRSETEPRRPHFQDRGRSLTVSGGGVIVRDHRAVLAGGPHTHDHDPGVPVGQVLSVGAMIAEEDRAVAGFELACHPARSQPPRARAPAATRANTPTQSPPGSPVSRASWSASFEVRGCRRRPRHSSSTGRSPPNNRNHVSAYASTASGRADPSQRTATIAAAVRNTASNP